MLLLVGLTGGIGTGKSEVTNILRRKNYAVIDTDKIARSGFFMNINFKCSYKVVKPGKKAYKIIKEQFGNEFFTDNGQLDRIKLGAKVFTDSKVIHECV
jgi:dephospho-CoA kinase